MFFFGIASHLITLIVVSVFSLMFFYQGARITTTGHDEISGKTIQFSETTGNASCIHFADVAYCADTETDETFLLPPTTGKLPFQTVCCKILNETRFNLPHRGPPAPKS